MKKYITILFLAVLITPSITFASWWNPFSWSKDSKQAIDVIEPTLIQATDKSTSVIETKPKEIKVIEKIVEKPVIQTISVQDPALQKRIKQLELENQELKLQIEKLKALQQQVQTQKEEIESLKSVPVFSKDKECEEAKEFINSTGEKVTDLRERQAKEIADYMKNGIKLQKDIDAIKNKYRTEGSQIDKKIKSAKDKIQLYCD